MGISSKFAGERHLSTATHLPEFNERERARDLIRSIAGHCWQGKGDMIDRVYQAVRLAYPNATWTRRRLRAFWHCEQAGVRWREMQELEVVAELERARREASASARAAHNEFLTHISNTLDRLESTDAEFFSTHRAALREMASGSSHLQIGTAPSQGTKSASVGSQDLGDLKP